MGIPIRELQEKVSSSDFALYRAYNNIDPFENFRFDVNAAVISQTLALIHSKKGSRFELNEFMYKWDPPPKKKKKVQAIMGIFDMLAAKQNRK